jgi:acetylornithine deacetylase/succinyl-diaminopimelate desuccinylase-like protein
MHRILLLFLVVCVSAPAQNVPTDVARRPEVRKALEYIRVHDAAHLEKQVQIAEIPAPTFHEAVRARFMAEEFRRVGLKNVEIDKQGNVLGWRPGRRPEALVIAAHLDISFAVGVNTKVRKEGQRWFGPGLADDSRGLAALLAIVEALDTASIATERTLLFVANVGEEGNGNLIGMRYLFGEPAQVAPGGVHLHRWDESGAGGHWGDGGEALPHSAQGTGWA